MKFMGAIIGGLVAGIVGAVIWAAITILAQVEVGYVAWGIGALVGFGTSLGSRGGGVAPALIAVLITVASIAGGKYAAIKYYTSDMDSSGIAYTGEDAVASLIYEMPEEQKKEFESLPEVDEANYEDEIVSNDFPPEVWAWGQAQWADMSDDEQSAYIDTQKQAIDELVNQFKGQMEAQQQQIQQIHQ